MQSLTIQRRRELLRVIVLAGCLAAMLGLATLYANHRRPAIFPELDREIALGSVVVKIPRDWEITEPPFAIDFIEQMVLREPADPGDTFYRRTLMVSVRGPRFLPHVAGDFRDESVRDGEPLRLSNGFDGKVVARDREINRQFSAAGIRERYVRAVGTTGDGAIVTIQAYVYSRGRTLEQDSLLDLVKRVAESIRDLPPQ